MMMSSDLVYSAMTMYLLKGKKSIYSLYLFLCSDIYIYL